MFYLYLKIYVVLTLLIFISCSNSLIQIEKISEQIIIVDTQTWINLMPGGPGSFHITGEYEIDKSFSKDLKLMKLIVSTDNKTIYDIKSGNIVNELQADETDQKLKYRFNTQPGIKLNESIRIVEKINLKLVFNFNGNIIEKMISDVYLTRAY